MALGGPVPSGSSSFCFLGFLVSGDLLPSLGHGSFFCLQSQEGGISDSASSIFLPFHIVSLVHADDLSSSKVL